MLYELDGWPIKDTPIFPNPHTGKPYINFYCSWDNARKRAGLKDFRIHDLRHSFASSLVNAGRSLYEVQELLGHADIKTTSRYAHLSRERLIEAVQVLPNIKIGIKLPRIAKPELYLTATVVECEDHKNAEQLNLATQTRTNYLKFG